MATVIEDQFDKAADLARAIGGELYARNHQFLFLVKGINVSEKSALPGEVHALDAIQTLI